MLVKGIRSAAALVVGGLLIAGCSSGSQPVKAAGSSTPPGTPAATTPASSSAPATASARGSSTAAAPKVPSGPSGGPVPARFVPYSTTFVSASEGWVLGDAPCSAAPCTSIVRTRDGGRSWQGIPAPRAPLMPLNGAPPVGTVSTIRFADDNDGWVAGESLYATHNGGASWTKIPIVPGGGVITAVGTGAGRVYASVSTCGYRSGPA